eukprot:9337002-Pyramimonas_sp.AAC.1
MIVIPGGMFYPSPAMWLRDDLPPYYFPIHASWQRGGGISRLVDRVHMSHMLWGIPNSRVFGDDRGRILLCT